MVPLSSQSQAQTMESHPTIWISCSSELGTRLFRYNQKEEGIRFFRDLPHTKLALHGMGSGTNPLVEELKALNTELETLASDSRGLILCADSELLIQIENHLSSELREKLLGKIEQNLYHINESDLIEYVKDILPEYGTPVPLEEGASVRNVA